MPPALSWLWDFFLTLQTLRGYKPIYYCLEVFMETSSSIGGLCCSRRKGAKTEKQLLSQQRG